MTSGFGPGFFLLLSPAASALVLVTSGFGPGCFCNPFVTSGFGPGFRFFLPVASALVLVVTSTLGPVFLVTSACGPGCCSLNKHDFSFVTHLQ